MCHPGSIQGKVGWGSEQHHLVEYVSACHKEPGLDDCKGASQPKAFQASMILFIVRTVEKNCLSTETKAFKTSLNPGIQFFVPVPSLEEQHFLTLVCVIRLRMLESEGPLSCGICDHLGLLRRPGD